MKECPVTDLSKLQDALSWFLGQNEDQLLEETDSDNFTTHFMHWRQMISSMCNAGEHIDRKLYEEHVAHMIYQAKFALRNESNFDLPEWMVEYFQEGFNRYPVAERSAKRKRSDDNTKSVLLRSDPTEAFECIGYETRAIVGGGMFGEVKLGRHFTDGRMAALKSSNDRLQEDDSDEHTILGELFPHARINKSLGKHINMPKHGYTTLAHEFCNGNPVGNLLRHAKAVGLQLPQTFICHIFAQLKEGLLHCYQRKIAHRDFDRNNWFFKFRIAGIYDAYPDVVIGDVGLAKRRFVIDDMKLELKELRILLEESPVDTNSKEGPYTLVFKKWIAAFERMAKAFDKAEKKPATGKFETPAELEKIHKEAVNYWLLEAQIPREHHRIV